ncbi:MAG TPA: SMC-Scp complex subunit ScpB [Gammaproteobacteria bacterium]|nr:SMC-Scp complex subunit ScpB [Gammaproteobacteria bacterium]
MDETQIKHVVEAALLAAGRPLTLDRLVEIFAAKGDGGPDRATLKQAVEALAKDYEGRGIELKEVATGYRVQIRNTMTDWLQPLWEERAPRYTRALLETLALVAYRQPITRAEIEEVRGVVVSTNIVRTLLERNWIRVVGHRDVPGKPAMFGTTKDFLDYFGLKKLEDLPTLAELKDGLPELSPQTDLVETLEADARGVDAVLSEGEGDAVASVTVLSAAVGPIDEPEEDDAADDDSELAGADLLSGEDADDESARASGDAGDETDDANVQSAEVIPLRATEDEQ